MNTMQMVLTEEKADLYDAALDHVNDVRNELGLDPVTELLPGLQAVAFQCPISQTILAGSDLPYSVSSYHFTTVYDCPVHRDDHGDIRFDDPDRESIAFAEMSDLSYSFQRAFDSGDFPELIAE